MYCTVVFDLDTDKEIAFWWTDTMAQAYEKRAEYSRQYQDEDRYRIWIEGRN